MRRYLVSTAQTAHTIPVSAEDEPAARAAVERLGLTVTAVAEALAVTPPLSRPSRPPRPAVGATERLVARSPADRDELLRQLEYLYGLAPGSLRVVSDEESAQMERERRALAADSLIRHADVPRVYRDLGITTFLDGGGDRAALKACSDWLDGLTTDGHTGLFLTGKLGRGKTFLAQWTLQQWIDRNLQPAKLVKMLSLLQDMRDGMDSEHVDFHGIIRTPMMVIDDVGAESPTRWVVERLLQVVDLRLGWGLPTVYTSNLTFDQLVDLFSQPTDNADGLARLRGERLVERIKEHCGQQMVTVSGANLRALPTRQQLRALGGPRAASAARETAEKEARP